MPALPTVAHHDQVAPVRLDWEGITCELKLKTKEGSKNLLSQVCTDNRVLALFRVGVEKEGKEIVYAAKGRREGGGGRKGGRLTRHLTYTFPTFRYNYGLTMGSIDEQKKDSTQLNSTYTFPIQLRLNHGQYRLEEKKNQLNSTQLNSTYTFPLPPSLPPSLPSQVTGHAEPGRLLAILGPSGSGKTTLLNVLAGQVPASSVLTLHGRLYVNGQLVSHSSLPSSSSPASSSTEHTQAYVRQQDLFYSQLTVRETLLMAARLRLPPSLTLDEKNVLVDSLLKRLGLAKAADTIVGDDKIRGISGGEKKRLSLACELLGSPSLIFADEPTSKWKGGGGGREGGKGRRCDFTTHANNSFFFSSRLFIHRYFFFSSL